MRRLAIVAALLVIAVYAGSRAVGYVADARADYQRTMVACIDMGAYVGRNADDASALLARCMDEYRGVRCAEDDPCWDCATMGNRRCGPVQP